MLQNNMKEEDKDIKSRTYKSCKEHGSREGDSLIYWLEPLWQQYKSSLFLRLRGAMKCYRKI